MGRISIFLIAFLIYPFTGLFPQRGGHIFGRVTDSRNSLPLERVNITVQGTSLGTVTGSDGHFRIDGITPGSYVVQASMTGYETGRVRFAVRENNGSEVNVAMVLKTYQIDSVSITAPKDSRSIIREPYTEPFSLLPALSSVSKGNIALQGSKNIIDAVNFVTGGLTETRGRQVKQFFSLRGQQYPYPDYALNGVWQQEFEELPYFFSSADIEKIEIVRSSAALLTGLSGLGGLINIKTREYASPETGIDLEYGSFNTVHAHFSNGNKIGRLDYALGAGYDHSDGPAGMHSEESMATLYSRIRLQASEKLSLITNLYYLDGKRELTVAKPPADTRYTSMLQNFDPYRSLLTNLKTVYRPAQRISSEVQVFYSYRNPSFNDEVTGVSVNEEDIEWGFNFMQSLGLWNGNTIRAGGLYNHWIAPNGKRFYTGKRCDTETISLVAVDEQRIGPVTLDAGLRWTRTYLNDYAAFNIEGEGSAFKNVTPLADLWEPAVLQGSFGVSWNKWKNFTFNFNMAAGQVKPRTGSLDTGFEVPENEQRLKFDLGAVKQLTRGGRIALAAFSVIQENAIALSGTTVTDTETGIVRELYLNRDQRQEGLELEAESPQVFRMLKGFANMMLMRSESMSDTGMVLNRETPAFISSAGLLMNKWNFDLNIFGKYVSSFENIRFAPKTAGPQPLGDFITVDITGGYSFKGRLPFRIYFRIRNLTDRNYSTVVGYPDFGRTVYMGLSFNLGGEKGYSTRKF